MPPAHGIQPASAWGVLDEPEVAEGSGGRSLLIEDAARLLGVSRRTVYYRLCLEISRFLVIFGQPFDYWAQDQKISWVPIIAYS
ncbi:MAG: hypothetical protein GEU82_04580 [Luteitalea sp.]|nr:hypothetical protein [Luteitalea sp.]